MKKRTSSPSAPAETQWIDAAGHQHALCVFCQTECSTHPDAGNSLTYCGDCGRVTCPDHRVFDAADRCVECASAFYAEEHKDNLSAALGRVLDRMSDRNETLDDAAEAVYPDFGGLEFRAELIRYAEGKR